VIFFPAHFLRANYVNFRRVVSKIIVQTVISDQSSRLLDSSHQSYLKVKKIAVSRAFDRQFDAINFAIDKLETKRRRKKKFFLSYDRKLGSEKSYD
jgi:hypothetical protein